MPADSRDPIAEFKEFNRPFAQRSPELFRVKIARMAQDPFAFFRGTFHLFARDVLDKIHGPIPLLTGEGAEMDLIGDIHNENYGTYQAADSMVYYGINDFDETVRGNLDFDVCRLAVSIFLVARVRGDSLADAMRITLCAIGVYTESLPRYLKKGKDPGISETSECGCSAVDDLVRSGAANKRTDFILKLTEVVNGQRRLARSHHFFNLPEDQREQAVRLMGDYTARMPPPSFPEYYRIDDICGRVAGVGSMGRLRYAVLVGGKGGKEGRNVIIEFKEARPSAYDLYRQRSLDPEALKQRAEEVVTRQRQFHVASNAHLGFAIDGNMSFQVREIGPHDFRVELQKLKNARMMEKVAAVHADLLGRAHARSATQAVGLANPLGAIRDTEAFCQRVLTFALAYADQVKQDWTRFVGRRAELERWQG